MVTSILVFTLFALFLILFKSSCTEKFFENPLEISNNRTKCEECCNQLMQQGVCKKKCIFEGSICRCCNNIKDKF